MKKSILFIITFVVLTLLASGCAPASAPVPTSVPPTLTPSPAPSTSTPGATEMATAIATSWELYKNEAWKFSFEYPTAWIVSESGTNSGFIGKQVFWAAANYDPMQQPGDNPSVDERMKIAVDGQQAVRVLGYYPGAIGDMGHQQYLRYVIHRGDVYYMFTLFAINALGIPQEMMSEKHPLQESHVQLFEQMIATLKFIE